MEHNAVLRPLNQLEAAGVRVDRLPCNGQGELLLEQAEEMLTQDTRCVILTHASNVSGTLFPIGEIGAMCRARGIFFLVDAAQTLGCVPVDMAAMGIDGLAFPGHKGLLGPQGIGGVVVTDALAAELEPLLSGGTGSRSESLDMPPFLPTGWRRAPSTCRAFTAWEPRWIIWSGWERPSGTGCANWADTSGRG